MIVFISSLERLSDPFNFLFTLNVLKIDFEKKLMYLIETVKKSKSVSKVYILTGTPVLQLSKQFHEDYKMNVNKIDSPYFDTSRFIAEVFL